ncbi:amidase family protein [Klenkia terrae]|uniref:amidase family protein n=1 Tax=Klenkia terrae TaxID=1052259 RepID=UPI0036155B2A
MAENGALATTVADLAVAHAVLADGVVAEPVDDDGAALVIAVSTRSPVPGTRLDAEGRAAVEAVVEQLRALGHTVVRRDPPVPTAAALAVLARWVAGAADDAEHLGADRHALEPRTRTHARLGRLVRRLGLVRPATAAAFRERSTAWFAGSAESADPGVDVLLTPVVTGPPLAARPWHERGWLANVTANARWAPWTSAWNMAGLPALVLPAGRRAGGTPLAVQFVGPRVPRRDYSGSRQSWSAAIPGAGTPPSSTPPARAEPSPAPARQLRLRPRQRPHRQGPLWTGSSSAAPASTTSRTSTWTCPGTR